MTVLKERYLKMIGGKFGRWTVTSNWSRRKSGHIYFLCVCECGNKKEVASTSLVNGSSQSCGCLQSEVAVKTKNKEILKNREEFKEKVRVAVGEEYTFLEDYKKSIIKIKVKHNKCGSIYKVTPSRFLSNGNRCPHCNIMSRRSNDKVFRKRVKEVAGNEYNFHDRYVTNHKKLRVTHNKCGNTYKVSPQKFLQGRRCPNCFISKGEEKVKNKLENTCIPYVREKRFKETGMKRFDFYLPSLNACIEYDGKQHFYMEDYWGGGKELARVQQSDKEKNEFCARNNMPLLRIPYYEIDRVDEIVAEFIEELTIANEKVQAIGSKTTEALEEAKQYEDGE